MPTTPHNAILQGDVIEQLATLPDGCVHCCVTSPPYWGLRDYGVEGQLGLEPTPQAYVERMVEVFREVRRVLRDDGTLWLNIGDCYATSPAGNFGSGTKPGDGGAYRSPKPYSSIVGGLKAKDLAGVPWLLAFALRADGWWLRQEIIWHKPNPMPESVTDRCTKAHESIFLLAKAPRYFYDVEAIKEKGVKPEMSPEEYEAQKEKGRKGGKWYPTEVTSDGFKCSHAKLSPTGGGFTPPGGRNKRSVWTMTTRGYKEAHFATFPPELPRTCILAGTSAKGCCPTCGNPWERVVERATIRRERPNAYVKRSGEDGTGNFIDQTKQGVETTTTGWRPGCNCGTEHPIPEAQIEADSGLVDDFEIQPYDPVPCIVLDPFMGSGTTAVEALKLGRRYIGVELNPDYVKLAEKRIADECPLLAFAGGTDG